MSKQIRRLVLGAACLLAASPGGAAYSADLERHIDDALGAAERAGIAGKADKSFLLERLAKATQGHSLAANIDLIKNHAAIAARIAAAVSDAP